MKNLHTIELHVQGTVTQTIKLNDGVDMSTETLVEEIQNGNIVTSIGHGENNGRVYFMGAGKCEEIGKVILQESQDDTEISISDDVEIDISDGEDFDA